MSAAPAQAQQVIIGNGGLDGFVGDRALAQSNGMGNGGNGGNGGSERNQGGSGGHDGDRSGGGRINAGNSGSGADPGTGGAGNSGGPLQVFVPRQPSAASGNLAGITSPPTFPSFTPTGAADSWNGNHGGAACALMMERVIHVGSEVYSVSFLQPTLSQCSDHLSLNFGWVRDQLALRLKAFAAGAPNDPTPGLSGSASGATSNLALALEYTPAERVTWTIESLMSGTQVSTQTSLRFSPSADWYTRVSLSGSSVGIGTSSTQQVEVGYQGSGGPQVAVSLGRQLSGMAEYDTTTFTLSTSLQDVSAQLEYSVSTMITTPEEPSAGQTYSALRFAFPMLGWLWTVRGTMADGSSIMVDVSAAKDNLSVGLSLTPLDVRLSYQTNL